MEGVHHPLPMMPWLTWGCWVLIWAFSGRTNQLRLLSRHRGSKTRPSSRGRSLRVCRLVNRHLHSVLVFFIYICGSYVASRRVILLSLFVCLFKDSECTSYKVNVFFLDVTIMLSFSEMNDMGVWEISREWEKRTFKRWGKELHFEEPYWSVVPFGYA